jgi:hypothetical protein
LFDDNKTHTHYFTSSEEEVAYLKRKVFFLLSRVEQLADSGMAQSAATLSCQLKELRDIKNSISWRITRPLRELNRFIHKLRKK